MEIDIKTFTIILLIIGIVGLGLYYTYYLSEIEICPKIAMLNVEYLGLYENLYDSTEMFFDYRIDNYGEVEANNVKVNCKIWDRNGFLTSSVLDNAGSVASNSYYLGEVITENIPTDEEGSITCYVESCDNCKILYKEIPELVDFFNS